MTTTYTGRVLTGSKRESTSVQVDIDGHSRPLSFFMSDVDPAAAAITALTPGQAVAQWAADQTNAKSGYIYPTNGPDLQFVGYAQKGLTLRGSDANLLGYEVSVITHGFVGNVQADGAILIGQMVMPSGKVPLIGSADSVNGSVKAFPANVNETRTVTAGEATTPRKMVLALKPYGLITIHNSTKAIKYRVQPNGSTLVTTEVKLDTDGKTVIFFDNTSDLAAADNVFISYNVDPAYIAGKAMSYAADNAKLDIISKEV